jgi:hypothetical protein
MIETAPFCNRKPLILARFKRVSSLLTTAARRATIPGLLSLLDFGLPTGLRTHEQTVRIYRHIPLRGGRKGA